MARSKAMIRFGRIFSGVVLAVLCSAAAVQPVQAKIVGVVFDDSGSMRNSYNLPLFGLQLLASTLDGRAGGDRLLVTRFGWHLKTVKEKSGTDRGSNIVEVPLTPQPKLQLTIDDFASWKIVSSTGTPFGPLPLMLKALAAETPSGQDAHLIVITDGEFESGLPTKADEWRKQLVDAQDALKAQGSRLEAHFLLILNNTNPAKVRGVRDTVDRQGIRSNLLEVFNGKAESGSYQVNSFADLQRSILRIIARVSETDERRSSAVVTRNDKTVEMNLPFAVSRVIALSIGSKDQALINATELVGEKSERINTSGQMAAPDTVFPDTEGVLQFRSTQFMPTPFLQPGRHVIAFNNKVTDDVVLLFRTDLSVGWRILAAGDTVLADSREPGKAVVPAGRDLTLSVEVRDKLLGNRVVNLADFPENATFEARVTDPNNVSRTVPLKLDRSRATVTGSIRFDSPGRAGIDVEMVVAGAPSKSSGSIQIEVQNVVNFGVAVEPSRRERNGFAVDVIAGPNRQGRGDISTVRITPSSPLPGRVSIAFQNLPADIEAVYAGTVLPQEGRSVAFTPEVPISIVLRRTEAWTGHIRGVAQTSRITLQIRAQRPLLGGQDALIEIVAKIAPARLVYRGHSGDRTAKAPLTVPIVDLQQAGRAFDFTVEDALLPPEPEQFSISAPGLFGSLLSFGVATGINNDPYALAITPGSWWPWCCLLGLGQGRYPVTVEYRSETGLPAEPQTVQLDINDEGGGVFAACLLLLAIFLLVVWFVGLILSWIFAYRFGRSVLVVERQGVFPDKKRLTYVSLIPLQAALWPFRLLTSRWLGLRIRENRELEGLRFTARPGGADILPSSAKWPDYTRRDTGLNLAADSPIERGKEITPIELQWGDVLIDRTGQRKVLTLCENPRDHQPSWSQHFRRR
jgi:hypothetical protein